MANLAKKRQNQVLHDVVDSVIQAKQTCYLKKEYSVLVECRKHAMASGGLEALQTSVDEAHQGPG